MSHDFDPAMRKKLQKALARCRDTCTGELPCTTPEYLTARREYARLQFEAGVLSEAEYRREWNPSTTS